MVDGLKRLEYRGYDSSGIAISRNDQSNFEVRKAEGKIERLEIALRNSPIQGAIGLGHTRWATHGKPNTINAHPHRAGTTVLVHNGIIENFESIREELLARGASIVSETDSELFGHLVEEELKKTATFEEAVRLSFLKLEGSCSIVVVNDRFPGKIVAVRTGTPLVVSRSQKADGCFVASDAQAIVEHTDEVTYLEPRDLVVCTQSEFKIFPIDKKISPENEIKRSATKLDWKMADFDKAGFPHFMLKEIHEQPRAILDTLDLLIERDTMRARMEEIGALVQRASKIQIIACGTAWHAGLVGKYLLESVARVPVEVDLASEYRYRDPVIDEHTLVLAVSQSGETADTLAALREAKRKGAMTAAICNVRGSSMPREVAATLFTAAGPEIGVASTKAFTTQILVFMMLGQFLAHARGVKTKAPDVHFFLQLPHQVQSALELAPLVQKISESCLQSRGYLYIARGRLFPIALEGALKMKEISYVHAEGYPAGELKHGPIAMVESNMTVVVLAPRDELYEKTMSNLQEVKARGGRIVAVGDHDDFSLQKLSDHFIGMRFAHDWSDSILATIPMQLLAYYTAVLKGTDVDKPRNLAKSVTVE